MTLTKLLPQDLLNDIVPAGQDKPMVWASKYYGTNASGDFGFFPLSASSVLQFANLAAFPVTGVANTLYIDSSTNQAYEWNGTSYDLLWDDEIQTAATAASFPATWVEGVVYIALDTDSSYIRDPTTSAYIKIDQPLPPTNLISRVHIDSWALIQWNVYPDYQEQTMTIAWDRYRSVELPVWYTTLTMNGIKTILHDDTAVRWSFVLDIMNNGASVHTITLPSWTSLLDTTWLSIPFADGDKFSVVITTADSGNTVWAEIFISYNIA